MDRPRLRTRHRVASVAAMGAVAALALTACTDQTPAQPTSSTDGLASQIEAIMHKPAYAKAQWSILAVDLDTGKTLYSANPDRLAFTGSTRKIFSVGLALDKLGAGHTTTTSVYRLGDVDGSGTLHGDLVLVGAGDLTFGGRRTAGDGLAFTDFDHNDANNLGTGILTPQNPLTGVRALAAQIDDAGVKQVDGDVVIDDRLFTPYRVPNQQLPISPTMLNENMVDVTVTPTTPGEPAKIEYRPHTSAFRVVGTVMTTAAGTKPTVTIPKGTTPSGDEVTGVVNCAAQAGCTGAVSGTIPVDYKAPLSGLPYFLGTFRIDDPAAFARAALVDALRKEGITVNAPAVEPDPTGQLPASTHYPASHRVAAYTSPPFSAQARLILKVSLNLGANLALTQFGLAHGQTTVTGALAAERTALTKLGIRGDWFDFPTNGSGSPDSRATPRALVKMLEHMNGTKVAEQFRTALPLLGVDGSLSSSGAKLPAKGHVYGKTGTTVSGGDLVAQNLAGYVDARSGHRIAYAIILNDYGPLAGLEDVLSVLGDEAAITNVLYLKG